MWGAAQETSTNRVNAITDWSVFEGQDPRECWAVTTYKESVNTRGGRVVAVTRGEILLMVFYRPGAEVQGQVAFTGGYPFAPGSTVNVNISGTEFELFTEGEWAWPATPQEDAKICHRNEAWSGCHSHRAIGAGKRPRRTRSRFWASPPLWKTPKSAARRADFCACRDPDPASRTPERPRKNHSLRLSPLAKPKESYMWPISFRERLTQ